MYLYFQRDKEVDHRIVDILRKRVDNCFFYEAPNADAYNPNSICYKIRVRKAVYLTVLLLL